VPKREQYYVQTGSMLENPHGVGPEEVIRMLRENPAEVSAQVIFGKYVELSGLVFSGESIQMMTDRRYKRVTGNTYLDGAAANQARIRYGPAFSGRPEQGEWGGQYHTGIDWARQTDYTVITTLDVYQRPARLVYWRRLNRVPWEELYREAGKARMMFGPNILFDGTGPAGDVIADALESRSYCPLHHNTVREGVCVRDGQVLHGCGELLWLPLSCCEPFIFSTNTKKELVEHLRDRMSEGYDARFPDAQYGRIRTPPIADLEEELSFYSWDDKKLMTDTIFSLALAAWSGLEDEVGDWIEGSVHGE
jgi:hypothetical protein